MCQDVTLYPALILVLDNMHQSQILYMSQSRTRRPLVWSASPYKNWTFIAHSQLQTLVPTVTFLSLFFTYAQALLNSKTGFYTILGLPTHQTC